MIYRHDQHRLINIRGDNMRFLRQVRRFPDNIIFPIFDPIASLLIALFLLHAAIRVFIEASTALIDRAASTETECALRGIIEGSEGVAAIGRLRTRAVGTLLFVEAEILLDRALPIGECDRIARTVRRRLAEEHGEIVDCVIVVRGNPPL